MRLCFFVSSFIQGKPRTIEEVNEMVSFTHISFGFNGAETNNCGIAYILGILLMTSYNTDIIFSNYYNLQSVHFESFLKFKMCQCSK